MNLYIFNQNRPMMTIKKVSIASFALLLGACSTKTTMNYNEPYRLQYHFSPPQKWMNDPNGLIYETEPIIYSISITLKISFGDLCTGGMR